MKTPFSVAAVVSVALLAPISGADTLLGAGRPYWRAGPAPTLSMTLAGGGPEHFATVPLVKVLAGNNTDAEIAALKEKLAIKPFRHS